MDVEDIINIKNFNWKTIVSLFFLVIGILFWIAWGITYGVWADIGIYSITIVLVLFGLFGMLLSLHGAEEE